jgi:hypothetical protein
MVRQHGECCTAPVDLLPLGQCRMTGEFRLNPAMVIAAERSTEALVLAVKEQPSRRRLGCCKLGTSDEFSLSN